MRIRNLSPRMSGFLVSALTLLLISGCTTLPDVPPGNGDAGNELKIPELLVDLDDDPDEAQFKLNVDYGRTSFMEGFDSETLGYNGSYLGPLIRLKKGEKVTIEVENDLAESTTVHWHGLEVDAEDDGGPHHGILPKDTWTPEFIVDQKAATLWYHPHLMGTTGDQVYYGLAGLMIIDDEESLSLSLPKEYGVNDIPLIVQDRNFNDDGEIEYTTSMMGVEPGSEILVNGTMDPFFKVTEEKIRLRILNGSNSENFLFSMSDNREFILIGTDGGFIEGPLIKKELFLAPGERVEVVVDFKGMEGETMSLLSGDIKVLDFIINEDLFVSEAIPDVLTQIKEALPDGNANIRYFEMEGMGSLGTINGKYYDMDRIDELVDKDTEEIWVVTNIGGRMMMDGSNGHPFHVHGTQFRILTRDGVEPGPEERGYKDTVYVDIGEEVRILVKFRKEGLFMYHCHILEHEDNGMMGQFFVD